MARWLPSYLTSGTRWLVKDPRELEPTGRFRIQGYDQLWTEVWSRQLDSGPSLRAYAGGMIQFDMNHTTTARTGVERERAEAYDRIADALIKMNVFEYSFCTVLNQGNGRYHANAAITRQHIIQRSGTGGALSIGTIAKGLLDDARSYIGTDVTILGGAGIAPSEALDEASKLADEIIGGAYTGTPDLVALLNRGASAFHDHSFEQALILAWAVTEACQSELWKRYISDAANAQTLNMNRDRRERLHGRDFTASVISEVLSMAGILSDDLKRRMDSARSARNKWMHGIRPPTTDVARESIIVACELLNRIAQLELPILRFPSKAEMPI